MATFQILVPTDYSACSRAALHHALTLAEAQQPAEITLLFVDPGIAPLSDEQLGILEPNRLLNVIKMQAAARAISTNTPIRERVVYGDPAHEIVAVAEEINADLIVMGTHGRSGFDRALLGSVAEQVIRAAPCGVLCVKATLPDDELMADDQLTDTSQPQPPDEHDSGQ